MQRTGNNFDLKTGRVCHSLIKLTGCKVNDSFRIHSFSKIWKKYFQKSLSRNFIFKSSCIITTSGKKYSIENLSKTRSKNNSWNQHHRFSENQSHSKNSEIFWKKDLLSVNFLYTWVIQNSITFPTHEQFFEQGRDHLKHDCRCRNPRDSEWSESRDFFSCHEPKVERQEW